MCPAGFFCPSGGVCDRDPTPCPCGSYCPLGSTAPTPCQAGSYCPPMSSAQTLCEAGSYCPTDGLCNSLPCNCTRFCPLEGMTEGQLCPLGSFCAPQFSMPCPPDMICPGAGPCPYGVTCLSESETACAPGVCQPGFCCADPAAPYLGECSVPETPPPSTPPPATPQPTDQTLELPQSSGNYAAEVGPPAPQLPFPPSPARRGSRAHAQSIAREHAPLPCPLASTLASARTHIIITHCFVNAPHGSSNRQRTR